MLRTDHRSDHNHRHRSSCCPALEVCAEAEIVDLNQDHILFGEDGATASLQMIFSAIFLMHALHFGSLQIIDSDHHARDHCLGHYLGSKRSLSAYMLGLGEIASVPWTVLHSQAPGKHAMYQKWVSCGVAISRDQRACCTFVGLGAPRSQGCEACRVRLQVGRSREAVIQGTTELVQAKRYMKKRNRLLCCVIVLVLTICAVIAIAVTVSLHPWSR